MRNKIVIGTRGSKLALWQAHFVGDNLLSAHPNLDIQYKIIKTRGDKILTTPLNLIGGKGLFTKELENELLSKSIDIAVHSLKDMPTELPDGLDIIAVTKRHSVQDVLIARRPEYSLNTLPMNATIATGSLRRRAQLLWWRPDLHIVDLRGNINTRITKFQESDWHGIILAKAGIERLDYSELITYEFSFKEMLPAVGQGAMAVEGRSDDQEVSNILDAVNDVNTQVCINAERSFLKTLGGGCKTPIAAYCMIENNKLRLQGLVAAADGKLLLRDNLSAGFHSPVELGRKLAVSLIDKGANKLLTL